MRFALSEDEVELGGAVRALLEREGAVNDADKTWRALAELGVLGLLVPEASGGVGLDEVSLATVLEQAGRAGVPDSLGVTAAVVAPLLVALEAEGKVTDLLAGRSRVVFGGVDVGVDEATSSTAPAPDVTQGTVVTSRVEGALVADHLLLCWEPPGSGWQLHLQGSGDVTVTPTPSIDGTRNLGSVEWTPWPHTLVASGDAAAKLVALSANRAVVATSAELLGLTARMIEMTAEYAKDRHQFGKPIGSFQAVKHHLANARVRLEMAGPAVYRAAYSLANVDPDHELHASVAKSLASDAADLAGRVALQVHGAIGYTWECDLHLSLKQAWVRSAAWGDAPLHRARILRAALTRIGATS